MPTRLNRRHQDLVRDKIKASQLINRLTDHGFGVLEKPLDASQVQALTVVLRKVLPDLSAVEQTNINQDTTEALSDAELQAIAANVSPIKGKAKGKG